MEGQLAAEWVEVRKNKEERGGRKGQQGGGKLRKMLMSGGVAKGGKLCGCYAKC